MDSCLDPLRTPVVDHFIDQVLLLRRVERPADPFAHRPVATTVTADVALSEIEPDHAPEGGSGFEALWEEGSGASRAQSRPAQVHSRRRGLGQPEGARARNVAHASGVPTRVRQDRSALGGRR